LEIKRIGGKLLDLYILLPECEKRRERINNTEWRGLSDSGKKPSQRLSSFLLLQME